MEIKSVAIIGLGLIGGSLAKAWRNSDLNISIGGYSRPDTRRLAFDEKVIDEEISEIEQALNYDVIFLCLPVDLSLDVFDKLAPKLKVGQILTDVCGVKGILQNKWDQINSDGIFFGGHPMTGKETAGYKVSDPLLFENSVYILTDNVKEDKAAPDFIKLIKSTGARIVFLNPFVHDRVVANVSHVPQLLSVSLVNTAARDEKDINYLDFAAGGFRDMTRIASSYFDIWRPVVKYNKNEIISGLNNLIDELSYVKEFVVNANSEALSERFESSRMKRDEIPKTRKGFLTPLYDLYVFVKDEPGVIAKISSECFNVGINIKDIELLKIREGSGGTFRLSFESQKDAEIADELMKGLGYSTKQEKEPKVENEK